MRSSKQSAPVIILGLGHIGASLAARLSKSGVSVWGWDRDPRAVIACSKRGWIKKLPQDVPSGSLCIIALPESAASSKMLEYRLRALPVGTLVTDVFSSKGEATHKVRHHCRKMRLRFAWSHPLAGREGSGYESADPTIFDGATVILEKSASTEALRELSRFWKAAGCKIETMSTAQHQRSMARGSHLMHVVAFAMVKVTSRGGRVSPSVLGGTRVAKSRSDAWVEILSSNRNEVVAAVAGLRKELREMSALLRGKRRLALRRRLESARRLRLNMEKRK